MKKFKFFTILAVMTLSMVMSVNAFKKSSIYMMISDNIEALTSFDGTHVDYEDGTCGVLFYDSNSNAFLALCGIAKDDIQAYEESYYPAQKIHWCCDSCPNSSYCN